MTLKDCSTRIDLMAVIVALFSLCLFGVASSFPTDGHNQPRIVDYPTNSSGENATDSRNEATHSSCASTDPNYEKYGMCWDESTQRLQISSDLSIEDLVRFYTANTFSFFARTSSYYEQMCDQSRRFNSEGLLCVPFRDHRSKCNNNGVSKNVISCYNNDGCICVAGKKYQNISKDTSLIKLPPQFTSEYWKDWAADIFGNNNFHMSSPDYWTKWADKLEKNIQKYADGFL